MTETNDMEVEANNIPSKPDIVLNGIQKGDKDSDSTPNDHHNDVNGKEDVPDKVLKDIPKEENHIENNQDEPVNNNDTKNDIDIEAKPIENGLANNIDDNVSVKKEEDTENKAESIFDDSIFQVKDKVEDYPAFAEICWFIFMFGSHFDIEYNIKDLKEMFEEKGDEQLIQYHWKLLRKRKIYINRQKWENGLSKFVGEFSAEDAAAITQEGYNNLNLETRLRIFLRLCETMFDIPTKFRQEILPTVTTEELRPTSFGRDMFGNTYWYHKDADSNFRLYKEDSEKNWSFVADNLSSYKSILDTLTNQTKEDLKLFPTPSSAEAIALLTSNGQNNNDIKSEDEGDQHGDKTNALNGVDDNETEDESEKKISKKASKKASKKSGKKAHPKYDKKADKQKEPKAEKKADKKVKVHEEPAPSSRGTRRSSRRIAVESDHEEVEEQEEGEEQEKAIPEEETLPEKEQDLEIEQLRGPSNDDYEVQDLVLEIISEVAQNLESDESENDEEETSNVKVTSQKKTKRRRKRKGAWYAKKPKPKPKTATVTTPKPKKVSTDAQPTEDADNVQKDTPSPPKKRKKLNEIDRLKIQSEGFSEMKRSSRIQILQQKKNEELEKEQQEKAEKEENRRRKKEIADALQAEQMRLKAAACEENTKSRRAKVVKMRSVTPERPSKRSSRSGKREKYFEKPTKGKKGKKGKDKHSWKDETHGDSSDFFDDLEYEEDENEPLIFDNTEEDFFECEAMDGDSDEQIVIRQARTAKAKAKENINDDTPCGRCSCYDNAEWILLCDKCDAGFHISCLAPPCYIIPSGDWYCPPCEHISLVTILTEEYDSLLFEYEEMAKKIKKKTERNKKALVLLNKPKVTELPIINEESNDSYGSDCNGRRRKKKPNYRFDDYDRVINDACYDEDAEYDEENEEDDNERNDEGPDDENGGKKKRKRRGSDGGFSDDSYNADVQEDASTDENEFEEAEATEEPTEDDEEDDLFSRSRSKRKKHSHRSSKSRERSSRKRRPSRKRRRPTRYESDETMTETEEDDNLALSESDESMYRRPRKAARKMMNYCESSTETEIDDDAIDEGRQYEEDDLLGQAKAVETQPSAAAEGVQEPVQAVSKTPEPRPAPEAVQEIKKEEPKEVLKITISKKELKVIKTPAKAAPPVSTHVSVPSSISYGTIPPIVSAHKTTPIQQIPPPHPYASPDRPMPIQHYEHPMYAYPTRPPIPPPQLGHVPHYSHLPHPMHAGYSPYPPAPPEYYQHPTYPPGVHSGVPPPPPPSQPPNPAAHQPPPPPPGVHSVVPVSTPSRPPPEGYLNSNECNPHSSHPPRPQGSPLPPSGVQYSNTSPSGYYNLEPRPRLPASSPIPHDAHYRPPYSPYPQIRNGLTQPPPTQQYSPIHARSPHPPSPTMRPTYIYNPPPGAFPPRTPFPPFYRHPEPYPFPMNYSPHPPPHAGIPLNVLPVKSDSAAPVPPPSTEAPKKPKKEKSSKSSSSGKSKKAVKTD